MEYLMKNFLISIKPKMKIESQFKMGKEIHWEYRKIIHLMQMKDYYFYLRITSMYIF